MPIEPRDEKRHDDALTGASESDWVESWDLDFVMDDGDLAATFEMRLQPGSGDAAYSLSLAGNRRPLVTLADLSLRPPKHPGLEIRAPGLWSEFICQTALDHFTVDVEAFAVSLDDVDEVHRGAYGDRVAVGCELDWETADVPVEIANGYAVPCRVTGEWLLDEQTIEIDGWGWRRHRWGSLVNVDWFRGRSSDGRWFHSPSANSSESTRAVVGDVLARAPRVDGLEQTLLSGGDGVGWLDQPPR